MTIRSLLLGLSLGLTVAMASYFNDIVMQQSPLLGNYLPLAIYGSVLVVLLLANPLLGLLGRRWPIARAELGVIVAVSLACSGWAGMNFMGFSRSSFATVWATDAW